MSRMDRQDRGRVSCVVAVFATWILVAGPTGASALSTSLLPETPEVTSVLGGLQTSLFGAQQSLAASESYNLESGAFGATFRGHSQFTLEQSHLSSPRQTKPGLAFLFSALVPGTGQIYNGNRRGYAFLGLELGAWFTRSAYLNAGNRKEGDNETYARQHWSYDLFFETRGEDGCLFSAESDSLIRAYIEEDPDRYYSEIASEDAYRCGWRDFRESYNEQDPDQHSPRRKEYRDRIDDSNSLKSRADVALGIMVVNRVISAVDAFRVSKARREGHSPSLRLMSSVEGRWDEPKAVIRLTKELR